MEDERYSHAIKNYDAVQDRVWPHFSQVIFHNAFGNSFNWGSSLKLLLRVKKKASLISIQITHLPNKLSRQSLRIVSRPRNFEKWQFWYYHDAPWIIRTCNDSIPFASDLFNSIRCHGASSFLWNLYQIYRIFECRNSESRKSVAPLPWNFKLYTWVRVRHRTVHWIMSDTWYTPWTPAISHS